MYTYTLYSVTFWISQGLNVGDLEDLLEDIEVYRTIEKETNLEFWKVHHIHVYVYMYIPV